VYIYIYVLGTVLKMRSYYSVQPIEQWVIYVKKKNEQWVDINWKLLTF
jgi:hypothetical protein